MQVGFYLVSCEIRNIASRDPPPGLVYAKISERYSEILMVFLYRLSLRLIYIRQKSSSGGVTSEAIRDSGDD